MVLACALALLSLVSLAAAGPAAAGISQLTPHSSSPLSVAITALTPAYAQPGKPVTVSGTVTNTSGRGRSGLSVQLQSSGSPFGNRTQLQQYADGNFSDGQAPVTGAVTQLPGTLAPHATASWSLRLSPASAGITGTFGVYPLSAQAADNSGAVTSNRTFLPFWPGTKAKDPAVTQVAWIWPLIDQPHQASCPGLTDDTLAPSLASGGRLAGLVATGSQFAKNAHLTWAVDPALLATASTMTSPYQVDDANCTGTARKPSQAAAAWLAQVKAATAHEPVLLTPYDDADIAALAPTMSGDLTRAYTLGRTQAAKVLGRSFSPASGQSDASMNATAWPADGVANYTVLEHLAAKPDDISSVVLDSSVMPPEPAKSFTPSAQTSTPDGEGGDMSVLLSDDTITRVLGMANSGADSRAAAFSVAQRYLAETAMITAEAPNLARSVVVAPPRQWDPPPGLASQLLTESLSAPWLRTASLSQLAAQKNPSGAVVRKSPPTATSSAQLPSSLLAQAGQLDHQAALLASLQASPDASYNQRISRAVMAVESSAWRGGGSAQANGEALAQQAEQFCASQASKLTIIGAPRVTLGGLTGSVPVSVSNNLSFPVRVGLAAAPGGRVTVRQPQRTILVRAGQQQIVKLQVTAQGVGSTTMQLNLVSRSGTRLPAQATVIVQATHYGDLALVIIIAALGIFLLTAAARAVRRMRRSAGGGPESGGDDDPQPPNGSAGPDTVMDDPARDSDQVRDHKQAEATNDYAWAPGQAERP